MLKKLILMSALTFSFSVAANDAFFDGMEALEKGEIQSALTFLEQAASEGHDVAPYTIGVIYEKGRGVEQDFYKAQSWYSKAAGKGHRGAKNRLPFVKSKIAELEGGTPEEGN